MNTSTESEQNETTRITALAKKYPHLAELNHSFGDDWMGSALIYMVHVGLTGPLAASHDDSRPTRVRLLVQGFRIEPDDAEWLLDAYERACAERPRDFPPIEKMLEEARRLTAADVASKRHLN